MGFFKAGDRNALLSADGWPAPAAPCMRQEHPLAVLSAHSWTGPDAARWRRWPTPDSAHAAVPCWAEQSLKRLPGSVCPHHKCLQRLAMPALAPACMTCFHSQLASRGIPLCWLSNSRQMQGICGKGVQEAAMDSTSVTAWTLLGLIPSEGGCEESSGWQPQAGCCARPCAEPNAYSALRIHRFSILVTHYDLESW